MKKDIIGAAKCGFFMSAAIITSVCVKYCLFAPEQFRQIINYIGR